MPIANWCKEADAWPRFWKRFGKQATICRRLSNRCCGSFGLARARVGRPPTGERASTALSTRCGPAASGINCPRSSATIPPYIVGFNVGSRPAFSNKCGRSSSSDATNCGASSGSGRQPMARWAKRVLGARYRPEPHGSGEKRHENQPPRRGARGAVGRPNGSGQLA